MDNFDKIISFECLYTAHRRARLGKRHKKEVIEFEMNLSQNLWALHYDLKYDRYKVSGYYKFMIYDPKLREIQAISYRDRVVQHSICDNYLSPLLERHLIYDNVACRKKKGTSFAIKRVRQFMIDHYKKYGNSGYLVKIDITKYFLSINHKLLKEKLVKIGVSDRIFALLSTIIDSFNPATGLGLPMGNQTSQSFALLYLDDVDRYAKEVLQVKRYIRYMDDMLLFVGDKEKAKSILKSMGMKIEANRLEVNPKSQIVAIKKGFNFLGWHFKFSPTGKIVQTVKQQTKRRIIHKCKSLAKIKNSEAITHNKQVLNSYIGWLKGANTFSFSNRLKQII